MKKIVFILIALISTNLAFGQVTIWEEDFESYANGTGIDGTGNVGDYPASVSKWTLDISNANLTNSNDYIKTTDSYGSQVMTARDTDGYPASSAGDIIWLSEDITISSYTDVALSARFRETGTMESQDYYRIEYNLDSTGWNVFDTNGEQHDDYGGWDTASHSGLLGNSLQIRVTLNCNAGSEYQNFDDVKVEGTLAPTTPTITVTPTSLSGFAYGEGNGPSSEQSFVVSGTNLTNNITISPDANWEISTTTDDGGTFTAEDPITLTQTGGSVDETTIYTRLKTGLLEANSPFSEDITSSSTGATDVTVSVDGYVYSPCSQLFISEYSSIANGNYFEIYNPSNADVDLSNYQIWRGYSGGDWSGADVIALTGTLVPGNTFSVARDPSDIPVANLYDSHMDYDGNDNIGLAWNGGSGSTFNLIDSVGDDNGDPGTGWEVAGAADATVNHTLIRKESVDYANAFWDISAGTDAADSEWIVFNYTNTTWWHHVSSCQMIPLMFVSDEDENPIIIGSTVPVAFNHTLYLDTPLGSSRSQTFEIWNAGNTELNLTGAPMVDFSGGNAGDFSVTSTPSSPVGTYGQFTTVTIEFTPSALGMRHTTVVIPNDNPFENPFVFEIGGEAYNACSQLFISAYNNQNDPPKNYVTIYNPTDSDVDLSNYEIWRGHNAGDWASADVISLSGTLTSGDVYTVAKSFSEVKFVEQEDADLNYNGNDNIGLAWNDGGGTFVLIDAVGDDGTDPVTGWDVAGVTAATLNNTLVRKSTVDRPNANWNDSRGTDATSSEWKVYDNEQKYAYYHVSNCVATPIMFVFNNDMKGFIPNGWTTPEPWNNTLFPKTKVGGIDKSNTYKIVNTGNTELTFTGAPDLVMISGAHAADFTVTAMPSSPLASNTTTTFTIEFSPTDYGMRTAIITIANDCAFQDPFVFHIAGEGVNYETCAKQDQVILFEDFEDADVSYTTSVDESSDDAYNYFVRYDGTNIGSAVELANIQDSYYFGVQDTDDAPVAAASPNIELYNIDIDGASNLDFSLFIAEDDASDGNEDWDPDTYMHVKYRIDGNPWVNLLWIESVGSTNTEPAIDNDFDGEGDVGFEITDTFQEIHRNIEETGSVLDIEIEFRGFDSGTEDIEIDNIELFGNAPVETVWDGAAWSNGEPIETVKAVIDGNYITTVGGSFSACQCRIENGGELIIEADKFIEIGSHIINNGTIDVNHEGVVVQTNKDANNTGTGTYITRKSTTEYHEYDYTYFASPSSTATIEDSFVPATKPELADYIWTMTTANMDGLATDGDDWAHASGIMTPGVGYAVLGDDADLPFDSDSGTWSNNNTDDIVFNGPFNNGDISTTVVIDADLSDGFNNQNLVGNPYPSAIDMTLFYNANDAVLGPNFHFWTHNTVIASGGTSSYAYNFTNDDYSTWNAGTGAVVGGSASGKTNNFIASAQGFLVEAADLDAGTPSGTITFTNDMRVTENNTNFLSPFEVEDEEDDRLWLNLIGDNSDFRQILIGFFNEATDGFDELYDGPRMPNGNNTDFFSVIAGDDRHFAIQGLHTFNTGKIVTLGLEIVEEIGYRIEIDNLEGVFAEGQDMFIYDSYTNTIHNLADGAYEFTSGIGDPINDRLTLRFVYDTTVIDEWENNTNLFVYQNDEVLVVKTSNQSNIERVTIYNVLGQELNHYNFNSNEVQIPNNQYSSGNVLLLNITLENGQTKTARVIKH